MATLKLNTASGGSITLAPTDTANNVIVSLPSSNATLLTTAAIGTTIQGYDATILKSADIGTTVQAYDATILKSADIGTTVQAYDSTILKSSNIGTTVQAYDADLTSWAGKTAPTGDAVGTTDTQTLTNKTLTSPVISTINNTGILTLPTTTDTLVGRSTTDTLVNKTITGTKEIKISIQQSDISLSSGNYFTKTISTTTTFTVSNVPSTGTAISFILDLTNGGSSTINWWSGIKWVGGISPVLTSSGRDVLGFFTHDGGTTWNGFVLGKDVK